VPTDRWLRIQELYLRALELEESQRNAFLESACREDQSLRREVTSLLAQEKNAQRFLESPAIEVVGKMVASEIPPSHGGSNLLGATVSHYRILDKIGGGGMGVVYKAEDIRLHRFVALKFLPDQVARDPQWLGRFQREAQAASALNHPNICTVYDIGEYDGNAFIAMEFLDGRTLKHLIEGRPLQIAQLLPIGIQIADALEAAHASGIVHRDVKPANIFLLKNGTAKLLDFGIAKMTPDSRAERPRSEQVAAKQPQELTGTGVALGTAPYMSPEQVRREDLDRRSDLFSFGVVLYEMATGVQPFRGDNVGATSDAILYLSVASALQLNPKLPPGLAEIVAHALEKDRDERYQNAAEMANHLRKLERDLERGTRPPIGTELLAFWRRKPVRLAACVLFIGALAGSGFFYRSRRSHSLTELDTVVLSDFDNQTGDPVFDDALKQAFATDIAQSPFLNVLADRKISQTLQAMGRSSNQQVTPAVGREICQRVGAKALLGGAISSSGASYVIHLNAIACNSGDRLADVQVEAAGKQDVLKLLGKASSRLREKLGESLDSVEKFGTPIEATTTSLEALNQFSMALRIRIERGSAASIPFLKGAIELDPNFPMAYAILAGMYSNLGQHTLAVEYATKAYQLRDRGTRRESLRITATYFHMTGDLETAVSAYQQWIASYPRDIGAHVNLGVTFADLGQHEKALPEIQEALRLAPDGSSYSNLGWTYVNLNRFDEAKTAFDQALARGQDSADLRMQMYNLAFIRGDKAGMEQQGSWARQHPGTQDGLLSGLSDTEAYYGRLRKARELSQQAIDAALRGEEKEAAALWQMNAAVREAEVGNFEVARKGVAAAMALSQGRDLKIGAALVLATIGDPGARTITDELEKQYPTNTIVKVYWLPTIKALIEMHAGNASRALTELQTAAPYELGLTGTFFINYMYPAYVRGEAYLMSHNGPAAAAEFQNMLDHPGIVTNFVTGALAHLQMARAYGLAGDKKRARAAYQDFFQLWQNADTDTPILKVAKQEYGKLR
jgi:eukaryotic-like serine/threonine-protein kinase